MMSYGVTDMSCDLTQVWGKFFASVDLFSGDQSLVVPSHTIKQRVFLLLMHAVTMDARDQGTSSHHDRSRVA